MTATNRATVVALFADKERARQAFEDLRRAGFRDEQLGVAARDPDVREDVTRGGDDDSPVATGATAGVVTGAGAGALWGLGVVMGVLPALGPVVAGGALVAIMLSAVGGAAAGGVLGALIGLGVPEEEARYYEQELRGGRILITVQADGNYAEALDILRRNGGYDMADPPPGRPAGA